jgi:hypothetical protein
MGQQSNLQTVRIFSKNLNLLTNSSNEFVKGLNFLKFFQLFFYRKNIILANITLNFIANRTQLAILLFFRTTRIRKYLKRARVKKNFLKNQINKNSISQFLIKNFKILKLNLCVLKISALNIKLKKDTKFLNFLYRKHKKFKNQLFSRREPLFFDFLKISCLFARGRIPTNSFLFVLGQIFKFLLKRKHVRFFNLVNILFKTLIYPKNLKCQTLSKEFKSRNNILGLKLVISGRLKGKLRSQKKCFLFGQVPNQSISKNIEFSKTDVFTRYGVFGLKFWTYLKI